MSNDEPMTRRRKEIRARIERVRGDMSEAEVEELVEKIARNEEKPSTLGWRPEIDA